MNDFTDPHEIIDKTLKEKEKEKKQVPVNEDLPTELQKVAQNMDFVKEVRDNPIPENKYTVNAFGKNVDVAGILKDNIWNRSIFTTDKLSRMFLSCRLEQLKKYQAKKRSIPFNMIWLIIILFGVVVAVLVILFLLPRFMGG